MRLSIVLLSHATSREAPTGAERSLRLLAAGLGRRGHRVVLVEPALGAPDEALAAAGVERRVIPCRALWLAYPDARPWPEVAARWLRFAWPSLAGRRIRALIAGCSADVVHVNCLPHLRGAQAARASGRPVVWHVREILPPGPRRRWFARKLTQYATRVVAVSEATAMGLREEGLEERVVVVHNGVEAPAQRTDPTAARRELGLAPGGVVIGLVGQLLPHKGVLDFVEAGRSAAAIEPSLRLLVAGPGPQGFRAAISEAIARSGAAERFDLLPPRPSAELLIAACDVLCLATRAPDPFPRAILEAMAAGKPVVAYRSGGAPEMVIDGVTGVLVATGDTAALAQAFVDLARDPERRAACGRAGAGHAAEEFSLQAHVERIEALYRSLLR